MSHQIIFDGSKYVSAAHAGETANLTRDYIARLCRAGQLEGRQVGKNWFVREDSLSSFLINQNYVKAKRRDDLIQTRVKEYYQKPDLNPAELELKSTITRPLPKEFNVYAALAKAVTKKPPELLHDHLHSKRRRSTSVSEITSGIHEQVHKIVAVLIAVLFVAGTYSVINPQAPAFALESLQKAGVTIKQAYESLLDGGAQNI